MDKSTVTSVETKETPDTSEDNPVFNESTSVSTKLLADSTRNGGTGIHAKSENESYVDAGDCVNDVACANGNESCIVAAGEGGNPGPI